MTACKVWILQLLKTKYQRHHKTQKKRRKDESYFITYADDSAGKAKSKPNLYLYLALYIVYKAIMMI